MYFDFTLWAETLHSDPFWQWVLKKLAFFLVLKWRLRLRQKNDLTTIFWIFPLTALFLVISSNSASPQKAPWHKPLLTRPDIYWSSRATLSRSATIPLLWQLARELVLSFVHPSNYIEGGNNCGFLCWQSRVFYLRIIHSQMFWL